MNAQRSSKNDSCYGTVSIDKSLHGQRLFEKQKMKKRENIILDGRQPFMNRVCKLLHTRIYYKAQDEGQVKFLVKTDKNFSRISTKSDGDSIYYFLLTIGYFYEFSTKSVGSWKLKCKSLNIFLFHTRHRLTAIIVSAILYFFDSNAHVGLIIEALINDY